LANADRELSNRERRSDTLVPLAAFVVIIAGLRAAAVVVVPVVMGVFLTIVSLQPLSWLRRRKVPLGVAVSLVVLTELALIGLGAALVGTSASAFADALPRYQARFDNLFANITLWFSRRHVHLPRGALNEIIKPDAIMSLVADTLSVAASVLSNIALVMVITAFILLEAAGLPRKMRAAFDNPGWRFDQFEHIAQEIQKYLFIKTVISLATGALLGTWDALLGIDFALLWGIVAFLLNYIPNIGSVIAAVPAMLLAIVQYGPGRAFGVAAGYLLVNMVLGNIVEPHLMGRRLGLSTLVVFLSLLFWGWVWGPVGMFLSVPLTMVARILFETSERTHWIATLLDPNPPPSPTSIRPPPNQGPPPPPP